jgi:hypothetical protein
MKPTTIIFDGSSLRMPVAQGGDVRLHFNGSFEFCGDRLISSSDVIEVFSALKPPGGGREWWEIFAANAVYRARGDYDAVKKHLEFGNNQNAVARNDKLIDWLIESRIYEIISFDVFYNCRTLFWHSRPLDFPRSDSIAEKVIAYCRKNPNPGRATLKRLGVKRTKKKSGL